MTTSLGEKSPEALVDELTYRNFRHNALQNPKTALPRWEAVYGPQTQGFIARLKKETSKN